MEKVKLNRNVMLNVVIYVIDSLISLYASMKIFRGIFSIRRLLDNPFTAGLFGMGSSGSAFSILGLIPWWGLFMLLVGFGIAIYRFVLFWGICQDINVICRKSEGVAGKDSPNYLVVCLLSAITFHIYYYYWVYKQGNRLKSADDSYYHQNCGGSGGTYLLLELFGGFTLGITRCVFIYKLLNQLNGLAAAFVQMEGQPENGKDSVTVPVEGWVPTGRSKTGSMECSKGFYAGAVFPIEKGELIIGRDESCANIVIKNPKISRKHCGISYDEVSGNYMVTDYSTNGTFDRNGRRFQKDQKIPCSGGTVLIIAQSGNEFCLR